MRTPDVPASQARDSYAVAVLDKALDLLECVMDGQSWSVAHLSEATGMTKTSVYRIVMTLHGRGYLSRDSRRPEFVAGPALLALGRLVVANTKLTALSRPVLEGLHADLGETINLAMLDHKRILYTDMIESPHGLRMAAQVGTSGPVYCTALGKAILAHQRNDEARAILAAVERRPYTANTKTGIGEVLEELEAVKTRGYAVDNEENEIGVRCVGVPILDSMGLAVAAISASGPEWRLSEDKVGHVGRALLAAAAQIEQLCGYQPETRNEALRGDSSLLDPPASLTTTVRVGRTLAKRNSLPTSATNSIATD